MLPLAGCCRCPGDESYRGCSAFGTAGLGAALAPALRALTIPLATFGGAALLRAWWLQLSHGPTNRWRARSLTILVASTATVVTLWTLRLADVFD